MSKNRLQELIEIHKKRAAECYAELMQAKKEQTPAATSWTEQYKIARDTMAYLETLNRRVNK